MEKIKVGQLHFPEHISQYVKKEIVSFYNVVSLSIIVNDIHLFGSQFDGTNHKWSDIDIVLVSEEFELMQNIDIKIFVLKSKITAKVKKIQCIPVKKARWTEPYGFLLHVKKNGVSLIKYNGDEDDNII